MQTTVRDAERIVESSVPARLDALPCHTFIPGSSWRSAQVTLAGAVSGALKTSPTLQLSDAQVGLSASAYLTGAVLGALLFGWLTDRFGRKRLFFVTLGVYVLGTGATALCNDFAAFAICRSRVVNGSGSREPGSSSGESSSATKSSRVVDLPRS